MHKLADILQDLPSLQEARMAETGYAVWLVWSSELSEAVPNTLQEYGGLELIQGENQSFWYFFSKDVFNALARLEVWANLTPLPVSFQAFEGQLLIGFQQEKSISIAPELYSQEQLPPDEFQAWVHPKVRSGVEGTPGITLTKIERQPTGIATASWLVLTGDSRIEIPSSMGWSIVIRAVGKPVDAAYMETWPLFQEEIEALIENLKLKFIVTQSTGTILFQLTNFNVFKICMKELLTLLHDIKQDAERPYWPCVIAAVEKSKYPSFSEDLPKKINLDWTAMAPDFPHMSYRSAFMLGDQFTVEDVNYSFERSRLSDWCYLHLNTAGEDQERNSLTMSLPQSLLAGKERHCFYCGQRNHTEQGCPTRDMKTEGGNVWRNIAVMNIEDMHADLNKLSEMTQDDPAGSQPAILKEQSPQSILLRAILSVNTTSQIRTMPLIWRSMGRYLPSGLTKLRPIENTPQLKGLEAFVTEELPQADEVVRAGTVRFQRDYQFRILHGFVSLEQNNLERAMRLWKESEPLGMTPMHFSYFKYLQARALEVSGEFDDAIKIYAEAGKLCPNWLETRYRQSVCMVKMGFSDHAAGLFDSLIEEEPNMFNRILIDPELERGYLQLLTSLWGRWNNAEIQKTEAVQKLQELLEELGQWFGKDHEFRVAAEKQINVLLELGSVSNYVAFIRLINGHVRIAAEFKQRIGGEIEDIQERAEVFRGKLRRINKEIGWFPFPKILREFNKDFNFCVSKLNWVKQQQFKEAKSFRKSHEFFSAVDEKLDKLRSRLFTLRIVRDVTLFSLTLIKTFIWLEIVAIGIALLAIPAAVFIGQSQGFEWLTQAIETDRWGLQKSLVIIVTVIALFISLVWTASNFERKKEAFFGEGDDE